MKRHASVLVGASLELHTNSPAEVQHLHEDERQYLCYISIIRSVANNHQDPAVQKIVGARDPVEVMKKLRSMKDAF